MPSFISKLRGATLNLSHPVHKRNSEDQPVKGGLAVSPAHMMSLAERGIPISTANDAAFYDGEPNPSWNLPLDNQRGVDINDMWNLSRDVRNKLKSAYRKVKENQSKTSPDGAADGIS